MARPIAAEFSRIGTRAWSALGHALVVVRTRGPSQLQFWFLALLVGIAAGFAAVLFRLGVDWIQSTIYDAPNTNLLHRVVTTLNWYWIVAIPAMGGLVVGLLLHHFTPNARVHGVAEVIEGAALSEGRVPERAGWASALSSFITLSTGGSSGREGPVVHLAALMSTKLSQWIRADGITGRDLLGCAVAGAVSASFNAPIAGALFALEVVLRHFAVHAFAPIVIASVAGTVLSRYLLGDVTEYALSSATVFAFYIELPAFLLLGLFCGLIGTILMWAVFWADDFASAVMERLRMHRALRPMIAGVLLGLMAIAFPHIVGSGYGTTAQALSGRLEFWQLMLFLVTKIIAVAITMGGRMGGGIFSPSLMVGAMAGLAFGIVATSIFPESSGSATLYALAGMGAVAAAVLGAPISTTLIVFELTGDWQTGLAVMVAVSLASALSSRLVDRSFFLTQLERRGIHLAAGPQAYLLSTLHVANIMRARDADFGADPEACEAMIASGHMIHASATLEAAMPLFEQLRTPFIPVVRQTGPNAAPEFLGALFQIDALRAFNRALTETAREEHS